MPLIDRIAGKRQEIGRWRTGTTHSKGPLGGIEHGVAVVRTVASVYGVLLYPVSYTTPHLVLITLNVLQQSNDWQRRFTIVSWGQLNSIFKVATVLHFASCSLCGLLNVQQSGFIRYSTWARMHNRQSEINKNFLWTVNHAQWRSSGVPG